MKNYCSKPRLGTIESLPSTRREALEESWGHEERSPNDPQKELIKLQIKVVKKSCKHIIFYVVDSMARLLLPATTSPLTPSINHEDINKEVSFGGHLENRFLQTSPTKTTKGDVWGSRNWPPLRNSR